jgi:hypothetical protein
VPPSKSSRARSATGTPEVLVADLHETGPRGDLRHVAPDRFGIGHEGGAHVGVVADEELALLRLPDQVVDGAAARQQGGSQRPDVERACLGQHVVVEIPDKVELVASGLVLVEVGGRRTRPRARDHRGGRELRARLAHVLGDPPPVLVVADARDQQGRDVEPGEADRDVQR